VDNCAEKVTTISLLEGRVFRILIYKLQARSSVGQLFRQNRKVSRLSVFTGHFSDLLR